MGQEYVTSPERIARALERIADALEKQEIRAEAAANAPAPPLNQPMAFEDTVRLIRGETKLMRVKPEPAAYLLNGTLFTAVQAEREWRYVPKNTVPLYCEAE